MEILDYSTGGDGSTGTVRRQLNDDRIGELFDLVRRGETLWRCDVSFETDSADPAFGAWKEHDVETAVEQLLGGMGWVAPKEGIEVNEARQAFIAQQQELAAQGCDLQRIVVVEDPGEAFRPGSGLSFRLQVAWPLLHMPPENVWMLPREICEEAGVEVPEHDVNWYGPECMMTTYYDDDGIVQERRIFDGQNPADDPDMNWGREYRQNIGRLVDQGMARPATPLDPQQWVSEIVADIRARLE